MRESQFYQLLTVENDQKDVAEIIKWFTTMKDAIQANDIMLLNYFDEIPISYAATIDMVDRGVVEITTNKIQLIAMRDQKITFLKSDSLMHNIYCKVQRINYDKNKAILSSFSYAFIRSARRECVRVKVKDSFEAEFKCDEFTVRGSLYDISVGGLSILIPDQADKEIGAHGTVSIRMSNTKLEAPSRLLRIVDSDDSKKYVFRFDPCPQIEVLISRFICQIQMDAIRELKNRAESLES